MPKSEQTILIVDDSADDYALLEASLRDAGYGGQIRWVGDGDLAVASISAGASGSPAFDLVILDYYLPRKNSVEVLESLMERSVPLPGPVVVLSSHIAAKDRERLVELGVKSVIEKPSDLDGFTSLGKELANLIPKR